VGTPRQFDGPSLQSYLHEHIPLSLAMQVSVLEISPGHVVLQAPLAPNVNHRNTVFGGSVAAVAILAAWSLVHTRLAAQGVSARVVIQRNSMEYDRPIAGEFTARAVPPDATVWNAFVATLHRRGKARIAVSATLQTGLQPVGSLHGTFVALTGQEQR
jgi:thioesterase domain-containing protein